MPITRSQLYLHSSSILLDNNLLRHTIHHPRIKLDRMIPGKTNLLGQVIRQQIHQIPIPVRVQQRLVRELGLLVRQTRGSLRVGDAGVVGDGEVEVEG